MQSNTITYHTAFRSLLSPQERTDAAHLKPACESRRSAAVSGDQPGNMLRHARAIPGALARIRDFTPWMSFVPSSSVKISREAPARFIPPWKSRGKSPHALFHRGNLAGSPRTLYSVVEISREAPARFIPSWKSRGKSPRTFFDYGFPLSCKY
jgi:hypothetical protein